MSGGQPGLKTVLADGRMLHYRSMLIMGIINITPDSFYAGSRARSAETAAAIAEEMLAAGADILDIGGESTRPGAERVDQATETARVTAAASAIKKRFPNALLSVDTYKAATARAAINAGADIINDISAMSFDPLMPETVRETGAPVVLMHTRGPARDMQRNAVYRDPVSEVLDYLRQRRDFAAARGIGPDKVILDPGIGFAKLREHNLAILHNIGRFTELGAPVLVGASRKTFIGQTLGAPGAPLPPENRLAGTLAVTAWLAAHGVHIARVHDVAENAGAARMTAELCLRPT
ncbi:MAG: dihydropteroate synthase [Elusimicrobiaceae bacterium]|nr:dihydropteroate synthase [Elusimicrobiaceae bacterium]